MKHGLKIATNDWHCMDMGLLGRWHNVVVASGEHRANMCTNKVKILNVNAQNDTHWGQIIVFISIFIYL